MIELKLTPSKFEEIIKKGYDLNIIFLLKMVEGEYDNVFTNAKISSIEQTIQRKGLVTPEGKLSLEAIDLLKFISSTEESVKLVKKKPKEDIFNRWWKEYPSSDTFEYKGKKFKGTRALKAKKHDCEVKINRILASGEYTIEELIMALKLEISQKAENSIKTNTNKMSYFQNSLTYLNQGTYDTYVELVRAGHKPEEDTKKTVSNETFI